MEKNKARVARSQAIMVDRLSGNFQGQIEREIIRATNDAVAFWEITGFVPTIPTDRLAMIYAGMIQEATTAFVTGVKAHGLQLETKSFAARMLQAALEYIGFEAIRRRITNVAETTRKQIVRQVDAGYDAGEGVATIAQNIRQRAPEIATARAALIARTETHGAANYGAWVAAKESGLPMQKEWVSVEDARTRRFSEGDAFDHVAMNGKIADMNVAFQIPGRDGAVALAMYPGDPEAPAACSINCRCALAFAVSLEALIDMD
jgi:hypothetical protein